MIFVTGATGLLGNCVVRELLARGEKVRVLRRRSSSREPLDGLEVDIVEGDLNDPNVLNRASDGCRAVVHCAALIHLGWTRMEESRQINVEGTRHVVEACLANGAKLIHVASVDTLWAAASPQSPINETSATGVAKTPCAYVVSKREADAVVRHAIRERQLSAVIVHPGLMFGPYDWKPSSGRMILGVHKMPLLIAPSGGCSVCDARDVASAIANSIDQGQSGESYILAGENVTYRELWLRILKVTGHPWKPVFPGSRLAAPLAGRFLDHLVKTFSWPEGEVNGASIALGQHYNYYSSAKAEKHLGYKIRPMSESLADAWLWLASRGAKNA